MEVDSSSAKPLVRVQKISLPPPPLMFFPRFCVCLEKSFSVSVLLRFVSKSLYYFKLKVSLRGNGVKICMSKCRQAHFVLFTGEKLQCFTAQVNNESFSLLHKINIDEKSCILAVCGKSSLEATSH